MFVVVPESRFPLGQLAGTPNVLASVSEAEIRWSLFRHALGDWGQLSEADRLANDQALETGGRLRSVYVSKGGVKFWIITEADRSTTVILLPEDY